MINKIKTALTSMLNNAPKLSALGGNLWIIYFAMFLLFGTITMYIVTWIWFCFGLHTAGLAELHEIIIVLCGAPFTAALCFLAKSAVDKDHDGYSDSIGDDKNADQNFRR